MNVGIRKIKNHLSQYLKLVKRGETVVITERNIPVAKIVPYKKTTLGNILLLREAGLVTWNGGKPGGMNKPPEIKTDHLVSDMIGEDRR